MTTNTRTRADIIKDYDKIKEDNNAVKKLNELVERQIANETDMMYQQNLEDQFSHDEKIMNQEQIIRITQDQQQELNRNVIVLVASFWMILLSALVLVLFYLRTINMKYSLIGIMGVWIMGLSYLGYYFYTVVEDPTTKEAVNDAKEYSKVFLRATLPDSLVAKCPEKCKLDFSALNADQDLQYNVKGVGRFSTYPKDFDYWRYGVPRESSSTNAVQGVDPVLRTYTCAKENDPTQTFESNQPCHVYPGYIDEKERDMRNTLDWGMKQTLFPRK